jgi:hypothetical protein
MEEETCLPYSFTHHTLTVKVEQTGIPRDVITYLKISVEKFIAVIWGKIGTTGNCLCTPMMLIVYLIFPYLTMLTYIC